MKISVIIPTYKPGNYIYQCINSICEQTLDNDLYEIIIVLNGSENYFFNMLSNFIDNINVQLRVSILNIEQPGVSNARNIGIDKSLGEYICFIDDDDIISDNYLEKLLEISSPKCVGLSNVLSFVITTNNDNHLFFLTSYYYKKDILPHTFYNFRGYLSVPVAKLIHRDIIKDNRFDTRLHNGEDGLFISSICSNFEKISFTDETATYYVRIRPDSASRKKNKKGYLLILLVLLLWENSKLLFKNKEFSKIKFYISRILGVFKNVWYLSRNK